MKQSTIEFREQLEALPREKLLELVQLQDPDFITEIERIEYVFEHKLNHLSWPDGSPIEGRQVTNEELAMLIDEPFEVDKDLLAAGISVKDQKKLHVNSDIVMWARTYLNVRPRAYQIFIMRHPSLRKVLRAGRRLGKTFSMAIIMLHYAYTHNDGKVLVVAPMKPHVGLIYEEIMRRIDKTIVEESIVRNVTSPQYEIRFSNGSTIKFFTSGMRSGGKCLTPDHDVLTVDGWKPIPDVVEGETILAWNKDCGEYLWENVSETHMYKYEGDLVAHEGKQISFRATPNHKLVTKTRAPNAQWSDKYADELKDYYVPTGGIPTMPVTYGFSVEELELWGWWLAEGSGFIGKMVRISQQKEEGRKRLVELAESLGLHYTTPQKEIRIQWEPPIYSGTNAYNKFIPRELMSMVGTQNLLDGLLGGDGWMRRDGWEYSSSSYQLANDVQELAVRMGLRANIREKDIRYVPVGGGLPNRHWIVSAYPRSQSLLSNSSLKTQKYEGPVHCVTLPDSGYFLVRHNGLVHVTGNSDVARGQEAHLILLDEMDYMHPDDLVALHVMLQQTDEGQDKKLLIAASTPTGRKEKFFDWCVTNKRFKEYWFPSYVHPLWDREMEEELREEYKGMHFRHEVEADWGEDVAGVYSPSLVDPMFNPPFMDPWEYNIREYNKHDDSLTLMGVDWDKYGAGVNIVVLEVCGPNYSRSQMANKIRVLYREEVKKAEYTLTEGVKRIIRLNNMIDPKWIYCDRGYGEVQVELLHQHGVQHPETGLKKKVKGVAFNESIEVRDPATMQMGKKETKEFMISTLRELLEERMIYFSQTDDLLYQQLTNYVVERITPLGKAVFGISDKIGDHAHDALILACLAYNQNYSHLLKIEMAKKPFIISSDVFAPLIDIGTEQDKENAEDVWGYKGSGSAPIKQKRAMTTVSDNKSTLEDRVYQFYSKKRHRPIRRKSF